MKSIVLSLLTSISLLAGDVHAVPAPASRTPQFFSERTIFTPPSDYTDPGTLYARTALLPSGALLATWENYSPEPPLVYFPIFQSLDHGYSWEHISNVTDQVNGFGMRYQPFLYVLPQAIGSFPKHTLLLAGNSIPQNLSSTHIDLYASRDNGKTWCFVSHIAKGGEAEPDNGLTPVWEPFLMVYDNQLVVFYSDQRDPNYGQKLVHQVSSDGLTWGAVVDDVAEAPYTNRPGMTTVSELPNGKYFMTFENGGGLDTNASGYQFPAYFKVADSPLLFNSSVAHPINTTAGYQPTSSPYNVWSPVGGKDGSIIVSTGSDTSIFVNRALGEGPWTEIATPESASYTRHLRVLDSPEKLLIIGGGALPPSTTNKVTVSVINFWEALRNSQ